ncbi:MAG: UDP-N-acetylmuramoyl-tripeptide--D-alanyl-D-alanine ligase [Clostridia bacterium]|nr:UDP-N-acetylmuramoyl-tripeptide--D-alanyl-D-alanine ligase [Clostridia bacterium]
MYLKQMAFAIMQNGMIPAVIFAVLSGAFVFFAGLKFLQALQQSGYDGGSFFRWTVRKDNVYTVRLLSVSLMGLLSFLLIDATLLPFAEDERLFYLGFSFFALLLVGYIIKDFRTKSKVPLKFTPRVKRLSACFAVLALAACFGVFVLVEFAFSGADRNGVVFKLRHALLCLFPLILPLVLLLAHAVLSPFEKLNNKKYVRKCVAALDGRPDLIKIGVTGSYGKTGVKEILSTLLSQRFSVLKTPESYNTPMGICRTVNGLKPTHEAFVAEMGARRVGDIAELAGMVRPRYAVITGITCQHAETFGSVEAVKRTKFELIESLPEDGFAVFSSDSEGALDLMKKCKVKCCAAGVLKVEGSLVWAEDIEVTPYGTGFTLCTKDERLKCNTVLLGKHNVSNICLSCAIALEIGLSFSEIAAGINAITPVNHRLNVISTDGGVTVIDDAYNASDKGAAAAMEVLDCFSGRKIVVTPGLVELGKMEEERNFALGKLIAAHADKVILVGKRRTGDVKDGLVSAGFAEENITSVS